MSEHDGFRVERDADRGVATITLDVPGKFNRVSMNARDELRAVFEELDRDDAVRFVVLTGAGEAFTAGGDIPGFLQRSAWDVSRLADNVAAPERCTKPVIAALRGYCFGVGLELALACDFRIAADDLQLGFPEVTIGMIPGSGGTQRLARLVGLGRAKDIVMRGRRVDAEEALALGLVTEIVPADELVAAVDPADRRASPSSRRSRSRWRSASSTRPTRARSRRGSSSRVSRTASSSRRTTSARASRPSPRSARPSSAASSQPRSQARPAASTTSSRGATSCMFPIASPAQPVRFTQRRNDDSGSRISSSSTSSGGRSIA